VLVIWGGVKYFGEKEPEITEPIKVGVIAPLSGNMARFGEMMKKGLKTAEDKINQNSSLKIELIYEDSQCLPKEAINALSKLENVDKVEAFVGPFCSGPLFFKNQEINTVGIIPLPVAIDYDTTVNPYLFSTQADIRKEVETMASFAYEDLSLRKIAIIYFQNDWGIFQKDNFEKKFKELGGEITNIEAIASFSQSDFRTELTKIKENNPDAIYVVYSAMGNIVNQIKELDIQAKILGQYGTETPDFLNIAGKNANGIFYTYRTAGKDSDIKVIESFENEYQKLYKENAGLIPANSYDALMIIHFALEQCKEQNFDKDCLQNKILEIRNYQGAGGLITSINKKTHGADKSIIIKTIVDGKFVELEDLK